MTYFLFELETTDRPETELRRLLATAMSPQQHPPNPSVEKLQ